MCWVSALNDRVNILALLVQRAVLFSVVHTLPLIHKSFGDVWMHSLLELNVSVHRRQCEPKESHKCLCLCGCLFICQCICVGVCLFVCLCVCVGVCLFICLCVCVSVCLFICLCICVRASICSCICECGEKF